MNQIRMKEEEETPIMAKRGHTPDGYYSATVARRKLGDISDGMLRSYIQRGLIQRIVPSGRKQGFYIREEVDLLAKKLAGLPTRQDEETGTQFQQATVEDIPECVQLLIQVFGGNDTSKKRQEWLMKNPETAYILKSRGKITGCAFVLPLTPEKMKALFEAEGSSTSLIDANDIQPLTPDKPVYLHVISVSVEPGPQLAKRTRGGIIVRGLLKQLIEWGRQGIDIQLITGRSDSTDGINLMRHMGFTEIVSHTSQRNFIIEVERSGIPFIMLYKEALAEYQRNTP